MYKQDITPKLSSFLASLSKEGKSKNTVKNYKSDIIQYLDWSKKSKIKNTSDYINYLSNKYSPQSMKRKLSSVNSYLLYEPEIQKSRVVNVPYATVFKTASIAALITITVVSVERANLLDNKAQAYEDVSINPSNENSQIALNTDYKSLKNKKVTVMLSDEALDRDVLTSTGEGLSGFAGRGTILASTQEATIYSPNITKDSLIVITPLGTTNGEILYIKDQGAGYAIVAIDSIAQIEINFNWILNNVETYQSIY